MASKKLSLPAPAKLNLFLHITGRRPDGYHNLQTIFQLIDYCDTLHFELRDDAAIILHSDLNFPLEQNLIWRAARALQQNSNTNKGATIYLDKRLPIGGGVGGGSSDAATTLVGLNKLWNIQLSLEALAEIGKTLGADVPVFVHGKTAWAEGIGEQLTPIQLPETWFLVVKPDCEVNTAKIFMHSELTRDSPRIKIADFQIGQNRNDCETLVRKLYPEVSAIFKLLEPYGKPHLTGTGSCVFLAFTKPEEAHTISEKLSPSLKKFICKGINRSPLLDKIS
jgi:4-diphosphocytidyl-2-C-methyl-D-erythritol kinase